MPNPRNPKVLQNSAREIILRVRAFCEAEKFNGYPIIPINKVRSRVAAMTGISEKTVSRITKEHEAAETASPNTKKNALGTKRKKSISEEIVSRITKEHEAFESTSPNTKQNVPGTKRKKSISEETVSRITKEHEATDSTSSNTNTKAPGTKHKKNLKRLQDIKRKCMEPQEIDRLRKIEDEIEEELEVEPLDPSSLLTIQYTVEDQIKEEGHEDQQSQR